MALEDKFQRASFLIEHGHENITNNQALQSKLRALYKQATSGDVQEDPPSLMHPGNRMKYNDWAELRGMSHSEAVKKYLKLIAELNPNWEKQAIRMCNQQDTSSDSDYGSM